MAATVVDLGSHNVGGLEMRHFKLTSDNTTADHPMCDRTTASSTTNSTTALTSTAAFGSVTAGMYITGTNIATDTRVVTVTDTSNIVMSKAATGNGTQTLTFANTFPPDIKGISFPFKTTGSAGAVAAVYDKTTGIITWSTVANLDVIYYTVMI